MATILIIFCLSLESNSRILVREVEKGGQSRDFPVRGKRHNNPDTHHLGRCAISLVFLENSGAALHWAGRSCLFLCLREDLGSGANDTKLDFPQFERQLGILLRLGFKGLLLYCLLYYLPLYLEAVRGHSPILTGVVMLPSTFGISPAAVVAGVLISVTNNYRWTLWVGWILTTLGLGLLLLLDVATSVLCWVFLVLISAVGLGIVSSKSICYAKPR